MRGMIRSVEKSPNGMLVLNIGGIKFRCYQELDKLGAGKKDVVDYDAVHDNDPRFTGTIIWIRKVPQSQQPVKAFNLGNTRMTKTAGMEAVILRTFSSIREEYAKEGKHHCLRLVCAKCRDVQTCRCSSPKITETGICPDCSELEST